MVTDKAVFLDDPERDNMDVFSTLGIGAGVSHDGQYGLVTQRLSHSQYYSRYIPDGYKEVAARRNVDSRPEMCKLKIHSTQK